MAARRVSHSSRHVDAPTSAPASLSPRSISFSSSECLPRLYPLCASSSSRAFSPSSSSSSSNAGHDRTTSGEEGEEEAPPVRRKTVCPEAKPPPPGTVLDARSHVRRHIVVLCHGVSAHAASGLFSASNLLQGRVDVWCRCVTAALYVSDDFRKDTLVSLVLSGEGDGEGVTEDDDVDDDVSVRLVQVDGGAVIGLAPAERVVALLIQQALQDASLSRLSRLGRDLQAGENKSSEKSSENGRTSAGRGRDGDDGGGGGGKGSVGQAGGEAEERGGRLRKSDRNSARRRQGWLAKQPGSRGPVPGVSVSDFPNLESCLREILLPHRSRDVADVDRRRRGVNEPTPVEEGEEAVGRGSASASISRVPPIFLLDIDGEPFSSVLETIVTGAGGGDRAEGEESVTASAAAAAAAAAVVEKSDDERHQRRGLVTFIVGDNVGVQPHERNLLLSSFSSSPGSSTRSTSFGAVVPVALGPRMLLASHCIVLAHAGLDSMREV